MNKSEQEPEYEPDHEWMNAPMGKSDDPAIDRYIADLQAELSRLKEENERLKQQIGDSPRSENMVEPKLQRLWEACITLSEKAEFKALMRYTLDIEAKLKMATEALERITPLDSNHAIEHDSCVDVCDHLVQIDTNAMVIKRAKDAIAQLGGTK